MNRPSLDTLVDKKDLVGAEIGVAKGVNAFDILQGLSIKKLYLIDPYMNFIDTPKHKQVMVTPGTGGERDTINKIASYLDKVEFIYDISASAVNEIEDNELDFVYIDGNHATVHVIEDITLYFPKVKPRGLVAGHDYDVPRVKEGVDTVLSKVEEKSLGNRQIDWWIIKEG